jgi:hypothetical protein
MDKTTKLAWLSTAAFMLSACDGETLVYNDAPTSPGDSAVFRAVRREERKEPSTGLVRPPIATEIYGVTDAGIPDFGVVHNAAKYSYVRVKPGRYLVRVGCIRFGLGVGFSPGVGATPGLIDETVEVKTTVDAAAGREYALECRRQDPDGLYIEVNESVVVP